MKNSYDSLLASRCLSDGTPHFWKPNPVKKEKFTLFTDDDMPVDPDTGIDKAVQKILALGLQLELPVGQWVMEARKKELSNIPDVARKLLATNIKDEFAHERGIRFASEAYPISADILDESVLIADRWNSSEGHIIERAALAETGVFLVSLAILRLAGGKSLAAMAEQISRDEQRHVTTNRGICRDIGLNPMNPHSGLRTLVKDTLDWVTDGFSIRADDIGESFDFDKDFLMRSSDSLIETGKAVQLDSLLSFSTYTPPFEVANKDWYQRSDYSEVENLT